MGVAPSQVDIRPRILLFRWGSGKPADDLQVKALAVDPFSFPNRWCCSSDLFDESANFFGARYLMQLENLMASLLGVHCFGNRRLAFQGGDSPCNATQ